MSIPEAGSPTQTSTLYNCVAVTDGDQQVLLPARESWLTLAADLLADGWNMCVDLTAVDYLKYAAPRTVGESELADHVTPERFEIVASFISHRSQSRIRARIQVPEADPSIDSLYAIYPGTDYLEREVFDMFGITFTSHPDMSRILMPEDWKGHPLRKDYATGAIPVQFKTSRTS